MAFPDPGASSADVAGPFVCETPNGPVALNSLTLEQLEVIEDRVNLPWMVVIAAPANRTKIARVVYEVCCDATGAEPAPITVEQILAGELFHQIESDMPDFDDSRDSSADSSAGSLDIDPKALDPGTDG